MPKQTDSRSAPAASRRSGRLRERWPAIAAFALLLVTIASIRVWSTAEERGVFEFLQAHGRWLVFEFVTLGMGAILGPVLAEAAGRHGWRRHVLTVATTFATVGAGVVALQAMLAADPALAASSGELASGNVPVLRGWWFYSMAGLLFGSFASSRNRALASVGAARAAELECVEMQRVAVELRIQALQARLEPQLVFSVLDEIGALFGRDPSAADALLDDLIAYLRAALPRNSDGAPTLADEVALVEAYLRILPEARAQGLAVITRIPAAVGSRPFPSAVLAPLAGDAAAAGATCVVLSGAPGDDEAGVMVMEVSIVAAGLTGVSGWTMPRLDAVRRVLAAFFGPLVALELQARPEGAAVVMRSPAPDTRRANTPIGGGLTATVSPWRQ